MMDWLTSIRPLLESLFFIAGVAVAIAALVGLQQVRLMKQDIETRNARAAREKAIEQVTRYFDTFCSLHAIFAKECIAKNLPWYVGAVGDLSQASLSKSQSAAAMKRFELDSWLVALNELQTIASAFAYAVADEEIGFKAIGRTFCASVV